MKSIIAILMMAASMAFGGDVTYTVSSTITTQEVSEADYKVNEVGYEWTEDHTPRNSMWSMTNLTWIATTNGYIIYGQNQGKVNGQDPFDEKVTVKRFVVVSNALYKVHVGPFEYDQATRHTILRRWQKVHRQKINMTESTETVEN